MNHDANFLNGQADFDSAQNEKRALLDGALPNGALLDGALPNGALPNGALPNGALPNGALPNERLRGLYVVTDARAPGGHLAMARAALQGGARVLQLRDKTASNAQLLPLAREIAALSQRHNALFLINDRVQLALESGADGVHLGPDDLPVAQARRLMPQGIVGVSCGTVEEARRARANGADMVGAGAVFATQTKSDAGEPIGLNGLREIVRATTLPVAAIGGITLNNISECLRAGARMACVVSALSHARDEAQMLAVARELVARINQSAEELREP